jgi:hypothetical protein
MQSRRLWPAIFRQAVFLNGRCILLTALQLTAARRAVLGRLPSPNHEDPVAAYAASQTTGPITLPDKLFTMSLSRLSLPSLDGNIDAAASCASNSLPQ